MTRPAVRKIARPRVVAAVKPEPAPVFIVLIDDNRLLREGLAALIHSQPGFKVLTASADVDEALQKAREAKPDVVLLDFGLEDHDSLALTSTVHAEVPTARVIPSANLATGGVLAASPSGAPSATHCAMALRSSSVNRESLENSPCLGSACQGGMRCWSTTS
jgi:CheY-like chemotaxis protein